MRCSRRPRSTLVGPSDGLIHGYAPMEIVRTSRVATAADIATGPGSSTFTWLAAFFVLLSIDYPPLASIAHVFQNVNSELDLDLKENDMARVVRFHEVGGPEVLKIEELEVPPPERARSRSASRRSGLNRAESMFRSGQYLEDPKLPATTGLRGGGNRRRDRAGRHRASRSATRSAPSRASR